MGSYVCAIDQGTTGTQVLLIDGELNVLGRSKQEFRQIFPRPGWVEHDLEDIWSSLEPAFNDAVAQAGVKPADIACIGITNQRETTALWERTGGKPVHNAIVWQCRRSAEICDRLRRKGAEETFQKKTGLLLDPYFSGTKLTWLFENIPGLLDRAKSGGLCFGTIDSWLVHRLTSGAAHVTDASNASRTLLMNLKTLKWDRECLKTLGVPAGILPRICSSAEVYGTTLAADPFPDGIPISGIAGDQQAALFGQACFEPGEAKCTYGTGAFLLVNTGRKIVPSNHRMLTTVAWKLGETTTYAVEGSAFIAGAVVQWLRDGLGVIKKSSEIEPLAASVPDSGGVLFVPAFVGLGAPHWKSGARGTIAGITRGTTAAHVARAALEGIAHEVADMSAAVADDTGAGLTALKVDGGAAASDLLMQFQSDILNVEIERPEMLETTSLGAAFLAGIGAGIWKDPGEIRRRRRVSKRFTPAMSQETRNRLRASWKRIVAKA